MKITDARRRRRLVQTGRSIVLMLSVVLMTGSLATALANPAAAADIRSDDSVKALALQWFAQMQTGQIDRSRLIPAYRAQLTNDAVEVMSRELKQYGAAPIGAEVVRSRKTGDQTFYLVKLVFPRGDSAAMLLGFDREDQITGIDFVTMAGD